MALPLTQLSPSPTPFSKKLHLPNTITITTSHHTYRKKLTPIFTHKLKLLTPKATQQENENKNEPTTQTPESEQQEIGKIDDELGEEIQRAMREREQQEKKGSSSDFWSGVGEEIREIEWPPFNKVLGTTGVVIGVIVGSSIVLLTFNAVLAELSDRVFAGRGVQDFFG